MKTLKILSAFLLLGMLGLGSCKKDDPKPAVLSTITTNAATNIDGTTATISADITNDGGGAITERGICFGLAANPTITDNKVTKGTGKGIFTTRIFGLKAKTTYHARAYSVNNAGVAYGNEVTFVTLAPDVYVAGGRYLNGNQNGLATLWKNGVPTDLTDGSHDAYAQAVVVSDTNVYVVGAYTNNNGYNVIVLWKNGIKQPDVTDGTANCNVYGLAVLGTDAYIIGDENGIYKYWKNNGAGITLGNNSTLTSITSSGSASEVYIAGIESNGTKNVAKYWKVGSAVPTLLTDGSSNAYVESMAVSANADVYVTGWDYSNNNFATPKYWKNTTPVTTTTLSAAAYAYDIAISDNNDVYVVGVDNTNNFAVWKNGTIDPAIIVNSGVNKIVISGSDFYLYVSSKLWKNGNLIPPFDGTVPNQSIRSVFIADK